MLTFLARFLSFLFHPLLLPTYAFLYINWVYPYMLAGIEPNDKLKLIATIFSNTFVFPLITVALMKRLNFVKSFYLKGREERIIPYIAVSLFYFWTFMVIRSLGVVDLLTGVMLGASLSVFLAFFFNLFFKISIHAIGAGNFAAIGLFMALTSTYNLEIPAMFIILFAGLIGSARIYLQDHLPGDIYIGYIAGFFGQMMAFKFILNP